VTIILFPAGQNTWHRDYDRAVAAAGNAMAACKRTSKKSYHFQALTDEPFQMYLYITEPVLWLYTTDWLDLCSHQNRFFLGPRTFVKHVSAVARSCNALAVRHIRHLLTRDLVWALLIACSLILLHGALSVTIQYLQRV